MPAILKVLNMRYMLLDNARICLNIPKAETKITVQDNSIYRYIGVFRILANI